MIVQLDPPFDDPVFPTGGRSGPPFATCPITRHFTLLSPAGPPCL